MSRTFFILTSACFALALANRFAVAQQPLGMISIDWNDEAPGGPQRNPDLIYKTLRAAFADTLKKKLNVNDPATVADLDMMKEGRNIRLIIMPKGAVQPTQDEVVAVIRESFMETLTNFLNDQHTREINQMRGLAEKDLNQARQRAEEAKDQLSRLRRTLREITHRVDVSPETLRSTITRLEDDRDKLALDAEAMQVRRKAIEQNIAKITERGLAEMKQDRVAVELEKLIASRENELKRMQQLANDNNVSRAQLEETEAKVGEARVRLWERQEIVNRTTGGDLLGELNKELAMLSINMAESEVRLERLGKAVTDFAKAVDLIDELENAQAARQAAQNSAIEADSRYNEQIRNLRQYQPPTINLHTPGRQP